MLLLPEMEYFNIVEYFCIQICAGVSALGIVQFGLNPSSERFKPEVVVTISNAFCAGMGDFGDREGPERYLLGSFG